MEQIRSNDWTQHIWKIAKAAAIFIIIGIITPPTGIMESDGVIFLWYFGFWFLSVGGTTDAGFIDSFYVDPYDTKYLTIGIISLVLLFIAFAVVSAASKKVREEKDYKTAGGLSAFGGILAFIAIGAYYGYLDSEFSGYWMVFDPSFGFFLPLIGGILGIIGGIAAGYAYSLESQGQLRSTQPYQPAPTKMEIDKSTEDTTIVEKPSFCKNCGTKLVGEYCQECGQKAEF
jgi:hypothetical protein